MSSFTFVAVGDAIITHRCSQKTDPAFLDLVKLIHQADVAFANFEIVTPRLPLVPSAEHGGVNLGVPEYVIDELKWMGFSLFSVANNHSNDFTWKGLVDTLDALKQRDVVVAGGGMNLGEARSPVYLATSNLRIGLVGTTTSYTVGAPAAPVRQDFPGRPGISHLRVDYEYVLDPQRFAAASELSEALGVAEVVRQRAKSTGKVLDENVIDMQVIKFVKGDACSIRSKVNTKDLDDICKWINDAKRQANFVVMSLHSHQGKGRRSNSPEVSEFLPDVAHRCIDAGADVIVGHGPHMLRAFEVYKGKPVFYSLGNFFYRSSQIVRYSADIYDMVDIGAESTPADVVDTRTMDKDGNPRGFNTDFRFWQSVVPVCRYEDLQLRSIDLYPIELRLGAPHRAQRGEPHLADATMGTEILKRLAEMSAPYGFSINIEADGERVVGRASWA